jgi:hypothetical protein
VSASSSQLPQWYHSTVDLLNRGNRRADRKGAPPAKEDAERAANVESVFSVGTGVVNSDGVSGLINSAVDAGLTAMGISNSGGCSQKTEKKNGG